MSDCYSFYFCCLSTFFEFTQKWNNCNTLHSSRYIFISFYARYDLDGFLSIVCLFCFDSSEIGTKQSKNNLQIEIVRNLYNLVGQLCWTILIPCYFCLQNVIISSNAQNAIHCSAATLMYFTKLLMLVSCRLENEERSGTRNSTFWFLLWKWNSRTKYKCQQLMYWIYV